MSKLVSGRMWPFASVIVAAVLILPVVFLLVYTGVDLYSSGGIAEDVYHVVEYLLLDHAIDTFGLLGLTSLFSIIFAVPSAYIIAKYSFRFSSAVYWLNILPLTIPTYVAGYIWAEIFSFPNFGYEFIYNYFGISDIFGVVSLSMIFASVLYPYLFVQCYQNFRNRFLGYQRVGESLGMPFGRFLNQSGIRIIAYPALYGLMLISLETLNDYGAVKYYGVKTFTSGIFKVWYGMGDLPSALMFSIVLLLCVISLRTIVSASKLRADTSEKVSRSVPNSKSTGYYLLATSVVPTFAFLTPLSYALYSVIGSDSILGIVDSELLFSAINNTVQLSVSGGLLIALLSVVLAFTSYHYTSKRLAGIIDIGLSGYSVPGAVMAVGVFLMVGTAGLTGSIGYTLPLVFAYCARYIMVGYAPIGSSITENTGRYSTLAISLGESKIKSLFKAVLPNSFKAIIASIVICTIEISKDLPLTLILRDYNTETLATSAYRYANDEQLIKSFPYGLLIIALGIVVMLATNIIQKKKQ